MLISGRLDILLFLIFLIAFAFCEETIIENSAEETMPKGEESSGTSWFTIFGSITLSVLSLGLVALYVFQDNLLYFPSIPQGARTDFLAPRQFGITSGWEEVFFRTPDGIKLQAWIFLQRVPKEHPTLLFFHGNAGNISHRLPNIKDLVSQVGLNVMILSYRGYGKSEGKPNEAGLKIDAQAALDYLLARPDIDPNKVIVFGRSLGGAVATHLVANNEDKIKALIIENSFTSIPDMIDIVFPPLKHVKFLSTNQWHSIKVIEKISIPILFLSGARDQLVPPRHMTALHRAAVSSLKREIQIFPHGDHMDLPDQFGYYQHIKNFVNKL